MVEINEMILRVPRTHNSDARSIGGLVARKIAGGLAGQRENNTIGELNMRLSLPVGASSDEMAENIAQQILKLLKGL